MKGFLFAASVQHRHAPTHSVLGFIPTRFTHAAEVWRPGVTQSGGWVDYNKSEADSTLDTVAGCAKKSPPACARLPEPGGGARRLFLSI